MPTTARDKIQAILKKTVANGCTVEEMLTANRMAAAVAAKHGIPNRDIDWPKLPDGYKWAGRDIVAVVPEPEEEDELVVAMNSIRRAPLNSSFHQAVRTAANATLNSNAAFRAALRQTMNPNTAFQTVNIGGVNYPIPTGRGGLQMLAMDLISRPGGATAADLIKATGWAPHSLRGYISTVRKNRAAVGLSDIKSQRARGGQTRYWID